MLSTYEKLIQGLLDKGFESVDTWLTIEELEGLRKSLMTLYENDRFRLAGIGNKDQLQTIKNIRNDAIYWLDDNQANGIELLLKQKLNDFVQHLNSTCYAGIGSYEFHYSVYNQGSFYKKHVDRFKNDNRRKFSMVFYLSEHWQDGDGGELVLYLGNNAVTIQPMPGRLVFFNSELPHEVLMSNTLRLSLTGWLKSN